MRTRRVFVFACLCLLAGYGAAFADQVVVPDGPPAFTDKQRDRLNRGEYVIDVQTRYLADGILQGDGTGYIVIDATPEKIFSVILDFNRYAEYYPFVKTYSLYARAGNEYRVYSELSAFRIIHFAYHHRNRFDASAWQLTWDLDPERLSDFRLFDGYWKTWPRADGRTLLAFVGRVRIEPGTRIPAFLAKLASEYALRTVVTHMKRRVESGGTYRP